MSPVKRILQFRFVNVVRNTDSPARLDFYLEIDFLFVNEPSGCEL